MFASLFSLSDAGRRALSPSQVTYFGASGVAGALAAGCSPGFPLGRSFPPVFVQPASMVRQATRVSRRRTVMRFSLLGPRERSLRTARSIAQAEEQRNALA